MFWLRCLLLLFSCVFITACGSDSWFGADKKINLPGERIAITEKSRDLEVDLLLAQQEVVIPTASHRLDWNNDNFNSTNTNFALNEIKDPVMTFSFSSSRNFIIPTQPIIIDNTIYILDLDGTLSAYNFDNGESLWKKNVIKPASDTGFFRMFRDNFISGGLKYSEGKIFITSGISSVICVDAKTGEPMWNIELSSPLRSVPQVYNQMVLVQTIDNKTFALNNVDGHVIWSNFGTPDEVNTLVIASLLLNDNKVIVHHSSDELYSLDVATGDEIWDEDISFNKGVVNTSNALINFSNNPILDDGYIFTSNNNGVLAKIESENGQTVWRKDLKLSSDIILCGNYAYGFSQNNHLIAVDKENGGVRWLADLNKYDKDTKRDRELQYTPPIMANGSLLVISNSGEAILINPANGQEVKRMPLIQEVYVKPLVVDGHLIVVSNNGTIAKY